MEKTFHFFLCFEQKIWFKARMASYSVIKRLLDLSVSALAILVLLPLYLCIALVIRLSSPGPVLFRQRRVGIGGNEFTILKFRTMRNSNKAEAGMFTPGDQSRITAVGQWLRSTKLDELPQFFNILRGDLSLVGPRPEVREWVQYYPDHWAVIHSVKPGIFDPAVIKYRDEEEILTNSPDPEKTYREDILPAKLALNEQYVFSRDLLVDMKILCLGVMSVFRYAKQQGPTI